MIELTPKDVSPLDLFFPQTALELMNRLIKEKIRIECRTKGHVPELYKRGETADLEFEVLMWSHRCRLCGQELKPVVFEEV